MTFENETKRDNTRALRVLVVVFILIVAVWASTGGLGHLLAEAAPSGQTQSDG